MPGVFSGSLLSLEDCVMGQKVHQSGWEPICFRDLTSENSSTGMLCVGLYPVPFKLAVMFCFDSLASI